MDLRPIDRANKGHEARAQNENARRWALGIAGLCIAAFESSQLVFRSATRPPWADASEQVARADAATAVGPDHDELA
jgi:hypothetical protein